MSNRKKEKVKVTCVDCGKEFEITRGHMQSYLRKGKKFRCPPCYKKWRKEDWYNELPEDQKKEMSAKRSELSKQVWAKMDAKKKEEANLKKANTRKDKTDEEKAEIRAKIQATWNAKSEEEMKQHSEIRRQNTQAFWDGLNEEGRAEMSKKMSEAQRAYFDSLSEKERQERADNLRAASQLYWLLMPEDEYNQRIAEMSTKRKLEWVNSSKEDLLKRINAISEGRKRYFARLSDEERKVMSEKHKAWWASLTEEEKEAQLAPMREGYRDWFNNLTYEEHLALIEHLKSASKKFWDEMSRDEFEEWRRKQGAGLKEYYDYLANNFGMNYNEMEFSNYLTKNGLKFGRNWHNNEKHSDFDKLFPVNTATGSKNVSPYHTWDFIVHTKHGDVLVDVDGSVHDPKNKTTGVAEFNDSKRPYQTDGLDAYAVLCYDDKLTLETPVINIKKPEDRMDLRTLIAILGWRNLSDKEQKEALKDFKNFIQ